MTTAWFLVFGRIWEFRFESVWLNWLIDDCVCVLFIILLLSEFSCTEKPEPEKLSSYTQEKWFITCEYTSFVYYSSMGVHITPLQFSICRALRLCVCVPVWLCGCVLWLLGGRLTKKNNNHHKLCACQSSSVHCECSTASGAFCLGSGLFIFFYTRRI